MSKHPIHVVDETFVVADPSQVRRVLCTTAWWESWLVGTRLDVREDRAERGMRWRLDGALRGSAEVWLEPMLDGVVVHCFLRADRSSARRLTRRRVVREYALPLKRRVLALKDDLERGRALGTRREGAPYRVVSATGTREGARRTRPTTPERPHV